MSIEGMWAVYFGDFSGEQVNSGIAVFETGRIFGGDSMMAYLGNFEVKDRVLTGQLKVWAYNPHIVVQTAFGKIGTSEGSMLALVGEVDAGGSEINGHLWELDNPSLKIPANLKKVSELPG